MKNHKIRDYFQITELVDKEVAELHGTNAWRFFDQKLLDNLLFIREELDRPITINNWQWGGRFSQRGLRHNQSPMVRKKTRIYLSAHMLGKAVDFDVKGMTATEVRSWIFENGHRLPHPCRLERNLNGEPISWVHLDSIDMGCKVYLFDV